MRFFLSLLIILFFIGCSNSNSNSTNTNPLFNEQWSIHYDSEFYNLNAVDSNAHINPGNVFYSYTGKGVKVAVIDEGFDVSHPEIKDKIIATINVDVNGVVGSDVSPPDTSSYHGTAVSGIIAAADNNIGLMGVAPEVELILIKMPNTLDDALLIELFTQAVDAGAQVINCSWGTGDVSDVFRDFMATLDAVVVFASGNGNKNMGNDESAMDSVVGVGATDRDNLRTTYSDYGKDLDIVAPGGYALGITTLDTQGSAGAGVDEYLRYNELRDGNAVSFIGTSASAPIISGVIALALQKNPNLTRRDIQDLLQVATSHIGNNTPYMDDMISSSSATPTITGIYGLTQNNDLKVRLTANETNSTFGLYSVDSIGNNEWSSTVTDTLADGKYTIEVLSSDTLTIWATDKNFSVNSQGISQTDKTRKKSDFYGYGKIDLDKFISLVP